MACLVGFPVMMGLRTYINVAPAPPIIILNMAISHFLRFTLQKYKKTVKSANVLIVLYFFAYKGWHIYLCIRDNWIENCHDEKGNR